MPNCFSNFIKQPIIKENKTAEQPKENNDNTVFNTVKILYELLFKIKDRVKLNKEIRKVLKNVSDTDKNFICWIICHYLIYNKITRRYTELIVKTRYSMESEEFILWIFDFFSYNKVTFPPYMAWYKFGSTEKKYVEYIVNVLGLTMEEYNIVKEEFNNRLSDREIFLLLKG